MWSLVIDKHDKATLVVMYGNNVIITFETNNCNASIVTHSLMLMCVFNKAFPGKNHFIYVYFSTS
jgi:hypothetical protein